MSINNNIEQQAFLIKDGTATSFAGSAPPNISIGINDLTFVIVTNLTKFMNDSGIIDPINDLITTRINNMIIDPNNAFFQELRVLSSTVVVNSNGIADLVRNLKALKESYSDFVTTTTPALSDLGRRQTLIESKTSEILGVNPDLDTYNLTSIPKVLGQINRNITGIETSVSNLQTSTTTDKNTFTTGIENNVTQLGIIAKSLQQNITKTSTNLTLIDKNKTSSDLELSVIDQVLLTIKTKLVEIGLTIDASVDFFDAPNPLTLSQIVGNLSQLYSITAELIDVDDIINKTIRDHSGILDTLLKFKASARIEIEKIQPLQEKVIELIDKITSIENKISIIVDGKVDSSNVTFTPTITDNTQFDGSFYDNALAFTLESQSINSILPVLANRIELIKTIIQLIPDKVENIEDNITLMMDNIKAIELEVAKIDPIIQTITTLEPIINTNTDNITILKAQAINLLDDGTINQEHININQADTELFNKDGNGADYIGEELISLDVNKLFSLFTIITAFYKRIDKVKRLVRELAQVDVAEKLEVLDTKVDEYKLEDDERHTELLKTITELADTSINNTLTNDELNKFVSIGVEFESASGLDITNPANIKDVILGLLNRSANSYKFITDYAKNGVPDSIVQNSIFIEFNKKPDGSIYQVGDDLYIAPTDTLNSVLKIVLKHIYNTQDLIPRGIISVPKADLTNPTDTHTVTINGDLIVKQTIVAEDNMTFKKSVIIEESIFVKELKQDNIVVKLTKSVESNNPRQLVISTNISENSLNGSGIFITDKSNIVVTGQSLVPVTVGNKDTDSIDGDRGSSKSMVVETNDYIKLINKYTFHVEMKKIYPANFISIFEFRITDNRVIDLSKYIDLIKDGNGLRVNGLDYTFDYSYDISNYGSAMVNGIGTGVISNRVIPAYHTVKLYKPTLAPITATEIIDGNVMTSVENSKLLYNINSINATLIVDSGQNSIYYFGTTPDDNEFFVNFTAVTTINKINWK